MVDTMAYLSDFGGCGIRIRGGDTPMSENGFHIDKILNQESLEWLENSRPGITEDLRKDISEGKTPIQIFSHVRKQHVREALAVRIRQAANAILDGE